jgi:hypothetical protein
MRVIISDKNSFRFFRKIFFAEYFLGGLPQKFVGFFCYFSTKKFSKNFFIEKTKLIQIFPFFPQNQKNFPLAKKENYIFDTVY